MPIFQTLQDARRKDQGFYLCNIFLPQDGTLVPKHDGYAPLKFVLIRTVYLVSVTNGALADRAGIPRQNRNVLAADRIVL